MPGPGPIQLLRLVAESRRDTLTIWHKVWQCYGDLVRLELPGIPPSYLLFHPDYVKQVLQERPQDYEKGQSFREVRSVLDESLFTSDGEAWQRRRRLIQPTFRPESLGQLAAATVDLNSEMLDRWDRLAERGQPVDLLHEMMWLTLTVVGRVLFGSDLRACSDEISRAVIVLQDHVTRRLKGYPSPPAWVPLPAQRRYREARETVERHAERLLAEHEARPPAEDDFVSVLLRRVGQSQGLTRSEVRKEILTMLLAGSETVYISLFWTWCALAQHQGVQQRLQAEVAELLGGRRPDSRDLPALVYPKMVFREALRLYPPGWSFTRSTLQDVVIGGYEIPSGAKLVLIPYYIHRHPDFWEEPERFDPDRFSADRAGGRARLAYFPFGAGPRTCIGSHFATVEAQMALTMIAQRFTVRLASDPPVGLRPMLTLHPSHSPQMYVEPIRGSTGAPVDRESADLTSRPALA